MSEFGQIDWAVLTILLPLFGAAGAFIFDRQAARIGLAVTAISCVAAIMLLLATSGGPQYEMAVGGWTAPLGIVLAADGLAALMIAMTGVIGLGIAVQALRSLRSVRPPAAQDREAPWAFWPLWLVLLAGLNALYLSADQFNLYVTLEIVSLTAVGLTALSGKAEALVAATRYLLVGLLASLFYLLGVTLLYTQYGVLDISAARHVMQPELSSQLAMTFMFTGLAAKTALFPLHFWLPGAHGNAYPPVSALLSALVVKASFYLILRLWYDLFAPSGVATEMAAQLLGVLGAGAIVWGSVQAILAERLKLLVAYSTVSQMGYLFLVFPLDGLTRGLAFQGAVYLALAHGFAKAALFLVCELVQNQVGHDRIADLTSSAGLSRLTKVTIGLAAVSLIGLPPSGGFIGKWLLMVASLQQGVSVWSAVIVLGTLLSAGAMVRVLVRFFAAQPPPQPGGGDVVAGRVWFFADVVPLVLALTAVILGAGAVWILSLLQGSGVSP